MNVLRAVGILACVMVVHAWYDEEEMPHYTNAWMAEIHGGEHVARRVARDLGFKYEEEAIPFKNHYILTREDHPTVSSTHSEHLTDQLEDLEEVKWARQQKIIK